MLREESCDGDINVLLVVLLGDTEANSMLLNNDAWYSQLRSRQSIAMSNTVIIRRTLCRGAFRNGRVLETVKPWCKIPCHVPKQGVALLDVSNF
jgi:hypothetical protein